MCRLGEQENALVKPTEATSQIVTCFKLVANQIQWPPKFRAQLAK